MFTTFRSRRRSPLDRSCSECGAPSRFGYGQHAETELDALSPLCVVCLKRRLIRRLRAFHESGARCATGSRPPGLRVSVGACLGTTLPSLRDAQGCAGATQQHGEKLSRLPRDGEIRVDRVSGVDVRHLRTGVGARGQGSVVAEQSRANFVVRALLRGTLSTPVQNLTVPPVENLTDRRGDEPQFVVAS
jgi:hypothetical protein